MAREIKFRAWDGNEMLYWEFGLPEMFGYFSNQEQVDRLHTLQWMQFTGLHNKNGKEIYEGDLLGGKNGALEVVWLADVAGYRTKSPRDGHFYFLSDRLPVIGNIYQNPELISPQV